MQKKICIMLCVTTLTLGTASSAHAMKALLLLLAVSPIGLLATQGDTNEAVEIETTAPESTPGPKDDAVVIERVIPIVDAQDWVMVD